MNQDQPAKYLAGGYGLLLAIDDAGVAYPFRVQPQRIVVVRYQYPPS